MSTTFAVSPMSLELAAAAKTDRAAESAATREAEQCRSVVSQVLSRGGDFAAWVEQSRARCNLGAEVTDTAALETVRWTLQPAVRDLARAAD